MGKGGQRKLTIQVSRQREFRMYRLARKWSVGESPTYFAYSTKKAIWILMLIEDPIKLVEVNGHSAFRRIVSNTLLTLSKKCELDQNVFPKVQDLHFPLSFKFKKIAVS